MRNIIEVIDEMLKEVPESEDLNKVLQSLKSSCEYSSPEVISFRWKELSIALLEAFKQPQTEWQFKVLSIMSTEPVEKIKEFCISSKKK